MTGLPSPWPHLVEASFAGELRRFVADEVRPRAVAIDHDDVYPSDLVKAMASAGYNNLCLPREFGGQGKSFEYQLAVMDEAAYESAALCISLITIFQAQTMIAMFGSRSLQERYLPAFGQGLRAAYALTEAAHGSDLRSLDTKAARTPNGWRLRGTKSFITSGSEADLFIVLAETDAGVSVFAIDRVAPGVSMTMGPEVETFGLRNGPHVDLNIDDVLVPDDHMIGLEGKGVRQAVTVLDYSRVLAAGISLGVARAAFDHARAFVTDRQAFDRRVVDFQGIQWYLADMLTEIDAARVLCYFAAQQLEAGNEIVRYSSEAKLKASQVATHVATLSVRLCGARGTLVSEPVGRYLRDAVCYEVAGGSVEILRNSIGKVLVRAANET